MKIILYIIIAVFLVHLYFKLFKVPRVTSLNLITGGVKTGKSTLSTYLAIKNYKKALRRYKIKKILYLLFPKKRKELEKPLLYSNVPLNCEYVPLTEDLILRKKRFAYDSVIYVQEASLLADSMDFKDEQKNDALRLFNKLIAHETHGGILIYDTQAVSDCHFAIKRCLTSYFYIHHAVKWIPFFVVLYVREFLYSSEMDGISNVLDDDVEHAGLRRVIIPKRIWKMFDSQTYSGLTDDLEPVTDVIDGKKLPDLKSRSYLHLENKSKNKGGNTHA